MKVLVTDVNGFVGAEAVRRLQQRGAEVLSTVRACGPGETVSGSFSVGAIDGGACWQAAFAGVDAVVHATARGHMMQDRGPDPLAAFRRVNSEDSVNLARKRRSLVGLNNLTGLIACCATYPAVAGQVFFAADGEDVSTAELLTRVGAVLGKLARLIPVPVVLLQAGSRLAGCGAAVQRLCGSRQMDIGVNARLLGWRPSVSLDAGLKQHAGAFRAVQAAWNGNAGSRV